MLLLFVEGGILDENSYQPSCDGHQSRPISLLKGICHYRIDEVRFYLRTQPRTAAKVVLSVKFLGRHC